jgi:hypothetical protein
VAHYVRDIHFRYYILGCTENLLFLFVLNPLKFKLDEKGFALHRIGNGGVLSTCTCPLHCLYLYLYLLLNIVLHINSMTNT